MLFLIPTSKGYGQKSDIDHALINVGVGSFIGAIGAVINKEADQDFGKVLLQGGVQGALGGYILFESKRILHKFSGEEKYIYIWPSKLLNAAGNSIIENAAANRNFWVQWHLNIGFNRIDIYTKDKFRMRYRIMPFNLVNTISTASNFDFDFSESLKLGVAVFKAKIIQSRDRRLGGGTIDNFIILNNSASSKITAHELIHTYQYEQLSGFNTYLNKPSKWLQEESKIYRLYSKYFYTDWNSVLTRELYQLEMEYRENIFEKEASYFVR